MCSEEVIGGMPVEIIKKKYKHKHGHKGISWCNNENKWKVCVYLNGKVKFVACTSAAVGL